MSVIEEFAKLIERVDEGEINIHENMHLLAGFKERMSEEDKPIMADMLWEMKRREVLRSTDRAGSSEVLIALGVRV